MEQTGEQFSLGDHLLHHVANSHEWNLQLPFIPTLPLPAPLSLHLVMQFIAVGLLGFVFWRFFDFKGKYPRGRWTNAIEAVVIFVRDDIAISMLGEEDGRKLTPLLCSFFFIILILNLMGLIPIFSTATANYNVTGGLMLVTFGFMTVGAIRKVGLKKFCGAFVLPDLPAWLTPLGVFIEVLSFFIKPTVLMIRLFANMLGGHFVILTLTGLTAVLGAVIVPGVVPVVVFVYCLEIIVAFFQAFVFTVLSAQFIAMMYHPEH
ncbi:MAG: F0F1 ATP synthase subunit A [Candidatus Omnitrophica bacterium]|nr:F0F1 ATP synthase subunit A [Candidatus Omnitrophota bacterium]MCB9722126.1 F0F1 ATP synthase subunit A [Candidatus Omnitrophota bacterium]